MCEGVHKLTCTETIPLSVRTTTSFFFFKTEEEKNEKNKNKGMSDFCFGRTDTGRHNRGANDNGGDSSDKFLRRDCLMVTIPADTTGTLMDVYKA